MNSLPSTFRNSGKAFEKLESFCLFINQLNLNLYWHSCMQTLKQICCRTPENLLLHGEESDTKAVHVFIQYMDVPGFNLLPVSCTHQWISTERPPGPFPPQIPCTCHSYKSPFPPSAFTKDLTLQFLHAVSQ